MRTILHMFCLTVVTLFTALNVSAYDFEVDGIYYNVISLDDMTCEVTYGDEKYSGDIVIPSQVSYNNRKIAIVSIGARAFSECEGLTSIVIPDVVNSIGTSAFYECTKLTSIIIPKSVISIGIQAFYRCRSLESISIPNSVTVIEKRTFFGCSSLSSITIPDSVITIGEEAFCSCHSIVLITIPDSVKEIGNNAFRYCESLESVSMSNSVAYIGEDAFSDCKSLQSIVIPDSVTTIESYTFHNCKSLQSITLPNSVKTIGGGAFRDCVSLQSITIPNSVTTIKPYTFSGCKSLMSIILSDSLKSIERGLFTDCEQLETLNLPGSIKYISQYALNTRGEAVDNTFKNCNKLTTLRLLHSTESLSVGYFKEQSLKYIGNTWDSYWTYRINELYIDRPLVCGITVPNLEKLELGESIKTVQVNSINKLEKLIIIKSHALVPPALSDMSNAQYMNMQVKVPYEALEAYRQADVWKNFWNLEGFDPNAIEAEIISINIQEAELNIGETVQLEATVLPEDTTDKTIEWKSSNDEIVIVDEFGLVTAISEGSATITAFLGNLTATCEVTVYTPIIEAEQVVLTIDKAEINIGETVQLEATVLPEDTTDKTLEWKSSNEEVAIVDESGLVTAISEGYATISVTCGEASAQCEITVIEENGVESIFANPNSSISIYSTDGIIIKKDAKVEDLKTLVKGVYIIVSGEKRYKVSI